MKAKLVKHESKHESGYILFGEKGIPIGAIPNVLSNGTFSKLSFKNCQAIERGYDLDELATKICGNTIYDFEKHDFFRQGFQEAFELMGDKKFSEEDVRKAVEIARNGSMQDQHNGYGRPTELRFVLDNISSDEIIQSLQQTEWDVEICCLIDDHGHGNGSEDSFSHPLFTNTDKPKLDAEGCLILKRI